MERVETVLNPSHPLDYCDRRHIDIFFLFLFFLENRV